MTQSPSNGLPAPEHPSADPQQRALQRDIVRTREDISVTLDALERRLQPQRLTEEAKDAAKDAALNLVDNVKNAARDATIGKAERMVNDVRDRTMGPAIYQSQTRSQGNGLMDTIRANPLPAAVAGLSLGWLWMHRQQGSSFTRTSVSARSSYPATGTGAYYAGQPGSSRSTSEGDNGSMLDTAQQRAGQLRGQGQQAMTNMAGSASDMVSNATDSASDMLSSAADHAGSMAQTMSDRATGAGSSIWDTVGQNPIPAAMVAVGVGWLLRNRGGSDYDGGQSSFNYRSSANSGGYGRGFEAGTAAGQAMGGMVDRVQDVGGSAQQQVQRAGDNVQGAVFSNPLAVGAVALGVGLAVGMAAPSTDAEGRLMGDARENLMQHAQETLQDTTQHVQQAAHEAVGSAVESVVKQGLSSD